MSNEQEAQMRRVKAYFPYRIVYAYIQDGGFYCQTATTMHKPNKLTRQGVTVWILK